MKQKQLKRSDHLVPHTESSLMQLNRYIGRADMLLGIGLNAARQDPPISHLFPEELGVINKQRSGNCEPTKQELAQTFEFWIISNWLRDLLKNFSIFLDHLYNEIYCIAQFWRAFSRQTKKA
jgi:hypothetical protein